MMSLPSLAMSSYSHHEALHPAASDTASLQKVGKLMDSNDYFLTSIFSSGPPNNNNNNQDAAVASSSSSTEELEKSTVLPSPGCSQTSTVSKVSFDTNISLEDDSFVLAYSESDPEDLPEAPGSGTLRNGQQSQSMFTYIPSQSDDDYSACDDVVTSVDQIHINLDLVTEVEVEDSSLLYELTTKQMDSNQNVEAVNQTPADTTETSSDSNQNLEAANQTPADTTETSSDSNQIPDVLNPSDSVKTMEPPTISPPPVPASREVPAPSVATASPSKISVVSSFHRAGVRALSPRIHLVRTTPIRSTTSSPSSVSGSSSKTHRNLKQCSSNVPAAKFSTKKANDSLGSSPVLTRVQRSSSRSKKLDRSMSGGAMAESPNLSHTKDVSGRETTSSIPTRSRAGKVDGAPSSAVSRSRKCSNNSGTDAVSNSGTDAVSSSLILADSNDRQSSTNDYDGEYDGGDGDDSEGVTQALMEYETTSCLRPLHISSSSAATDTSSCNALARNMNASRSVSSKTRHHEVDQQQSNLHITDEYRQVITATPNVTAMSVLGDIWSCSRITRSVKRKANELEDRLPKPSKQKPASKSRAIKSSSSSSKAKGLKVSNKNPVEREIDDMFELDESVDELLRYSLVAYHLRRPATSASYNIAELSRRTLLSSTHGKKAAKNNVPSNSAGLEETDGSRPASTATSKSQSSNTLRGDTHGKKKGARGTVRGKGKGIISKPQKRRAGRRSNDSTSSLQNWTCCLCKQGSNVGELGELYGPYNESGAAIELSDKTDGEDISEQGELWMHSVCAVWAPGVCMVGSELKGLKEALEEGKKMTCIVCKKTGAVMKCLNHSCKSPFHYPCAQTNGCSFNMDLFSITCSKHDLSKSGSL